MCLVFTGNDTCFCLFKYLWPDNLHNLHYPRIMENKRKTVEEFIAKGERLMEDPKSPKVETRAPRSDKRSAS